MLFPLIMSVAVVILGFVLMSKLSDIKFKPAMGISIAVALGLPVGSGIAGMIIFGSALLTRILR